MVMFPGTVTRAAVVLTVFTAYIPLTYAQEPVEYTQNDQHALVTPAVVRVVHHMKGEIEVIPFEFDVGSLTVKAHPKYKTPVKEEVDETISGTAFSISEGGLFVTNAHVASTDYYRSIIGTQVLLRVMVAQAVDLIERFGRTSPQVEEYQKKLEALENTDPHDPRFNTLLKGVLSFVVYHDKGGKITLLPQGASVTSLDTIHDSGFPVDTVHVPDQWIVTGRDIAVLKVTDLAAYLPALSFASSTIPINTSVAAYGFPGSTDLGLDTFTSITVTQGRVTSHKKISEGNFDAFQVDAKISQGSSGGPLVDTTGRVVGVITAESGTEEGDNFGFALPISLVRDLVQAKGLSTLTATYQDLLRTGLALKQERRCKLANESFTSATRILGNSQVARAEIDAYIADCQALIAAGNSLDTSFDEFKDSLRSLSVLTWIIVVGGTVIIIALVVVIILLLRKKKTPTGVSADAPEGLPPPARPNTTGRFSTMTPPMRPQQTSFPPQNAFAPAAPPQQAPVVQNSLSSTSGAAAPQSYTPPTVATPPQTSFGQPNAPISTAPRQAYTPPPLVGLTTPPVARPVVAPTTFAPQPTIPSAPTTPFTAPGIAVQTPPPTYTPQAPAAYAPPQQTAATPEPQVAPAPIYAPAPTTQPPAPAQNAAPQYTPPWPTTAPQQNPVAQPTQNEESWFINNVAAEPAQPTPTQDPNTSR